MTINKAQGQTFDRVGIHLPSPVFSHGQLYVAFSRAKSFMDISVTIEDTTTQGKRHNKYITQNIVYPEVLQLMFHIQLAILEYVAIMASDYIIINTAVH